MADVTIASDDVVASAGGDPLALLVTWGMGDTPWTLRTPVRVALLRLETISTYSLVAYGLSGVPGQVDPATGIGRVYPFPESAMHPLYLRVVRCYTPRLAEGVYYARVEQWDGANWVQVGQPEPFRVQVRLRHQQVYDLRRGFPAPPYQPGPQTIERDGRM